VQKQRYFRLVKRLIAFGVACCMSLEGGTIVSASFPSLYPVEGIQEKPVHFSDLSVPEEIGSIQETFKGLNERVVFVIQDAHEIPDAQRNIQRLVDYLQIQYGIRVVALEGAASDLDPQIFKSFPDQALLRKVFEQYFDQGELAGGTASAIFNLEAAAYYGVEDWSLYEEGLGHYLAAMEGEVNIQKELEVRSLKLEDEKKAIYSEELLEIDGALKDFRKNQRDLS